MSGYKTRGPGSIPGAHLFLVFFFFPFSSLMLHYMMLVKWHHQMIEMVIPEHCIIELCMKPMGMGLNLALLKDNSYGDPISLFLFLKGIIIVHEIKINNS